jgi:chemotaxis protein CheX
MDVKILLPFVEAIANVLPQLGFQSIARSGLKMTKGIVNSNGVLVSINLVGMLAGHVIYNITVDSAKSIASHMMMGMPVDDLNPMARSAVCELGNMLAANAAISLEGGGVQIDISPPKLIIGEPFTADNADTKGIVVEMQADNCKIEVNMLIIPKL